MKNLHMLAFLLLVIGGLNWLSFALTGWDVSQWFGGMESNGAKVVYVLVGLSALFELLTHKSACGSCKVK